MRILFFSDSHLGYDYVLKPRVVKNRRGDDFFANFDRALTFAREHRVDLVVHGGDLFFRSKVPEAIVEKVYGRLVRFTGSRIPVCIVPGNHERSVLPSSIWLNDPLIHVFDSPRVFHFSKGSARIALAGFPFIREIGQEFAEIQATLTAQVQDGSVPLLCLHQIIEGACVGPTGYQFRRGRDVIRATEIGASWRGVLAGHVHRYQEFTTPEGVPIIFSGSTERTSFAEIEEEKGFCVITIKGQDEPLGTHFHSLPARPMVRLPVSGQGLAQDAFHEHIGALLAQLPSDAVVKLDFENKKDRKRVRAEALRAVTPPTMSVHLKFLAG